MTKRAWILMGGLAALWGSSYMFIKVALDDGMDDTFIVWARTLLGLFVLAPIVMRKSALPAVRKHLGWLALIAIPQVTAPFLLITWGEHHVPSSLAGILVASAPIWTAIIVAFIATDERLNRIGIVGILIGIVGVAFLFGVDLTGDSDALLGGAAILLSGLGYAIGSLLAKRKVPDVPPAGVAASVCAFTALYLLPTVPFSLPDHAPSAGAWASIVILGAGSSGIAFLIYYTLNSEIGPSRASIVAYIAPVFSVFYGVTFMDEPFTVGAIVGLLLILFGSWLVVDGRLPSRRRKKAQAAALSDAPA
jgi:drug/metabolite transporter (DMT)-like permease